MSTILVSNRLPVTLHADQGDVVLKPSAGGLATALGSVHARGDTKWVGWPGDVARLTATERDALDRRLQDARLVPVHLTPSEVQRYYDGFSNGVLWPLCHYLLDKVNLEATRDWVAYRRVNERFADAVAKVTKPGDEVWVHDYQLALVPQLLRLRQPEAKIGFFLHIPFPSAEVFRILPWREDLVRGLLGADLVGFHTAAYAFHFAYAAAQLLGIEPAFDVLKHDERAVRFGAYPIGIDASAFEGLARDENVRADVARIRASAAGKRIVLGLDRLDYTKGIPRRLMAIGKLLDREPGLRDKLHFIQLAMPTREKVDSYADYRRTVNELVGRINGTYGTPTSVPIHLLHRMIGPKELAALYGAADVMLVTPLRDGMNLVAKEYVASRVDDDGVLVLSEFAGAATELQEAVRVNPYDIDGVAAALARAMRMPPDEQRLRMQALRKRVSAHDVGHWARSFLEHLEAASSPMSRRSPAPPPSVTLTRRVEELDSAPELVLLLDYDGTLVPFASMPDLAIPDESLIQTLMALSARPGTQVHLVSGRDRNSLERWFGAVPVGLHAEHGYWSRESIEAPWLSNSDADLGWKDALRRMLDDVVARTEGSFVEEKTAALGLHYRATEPQLAVRRLDELKARLHGFMKEHGDVEMLEGAKVFEVRLRGINKGIIASRLAQAHPHAAVLAIGDDRTDEDMFAALPERAVTVHVGSGPTRAHYRVGNVVEVRALLDTLRSTPR